MSNSPVPFRIDITNSNHTIGLQGDLDDSAWVRFALDQALPLVRHAGREWIVDAKNARVTPAGVEVWQEAVTKYLSACILQYKGQLSTILQFDDSYTHSASSFEDENATV